MRVISPIHSAIFYLDRFDIISGFIHFSIVMYSFFKLINADTLQLQLHYIKKKLHTKVYQKFCRNILQYNCFPGNIIDWFLWIKDVDVEDVEMLKVILK